MVHYTANQKELKEIYLLMQRANIKSKLISSLSLDVEAVHCNGCKLNFQKMLQFDKLTLKMDLTGIRIYIDRSTGKLRKGFLPKGRMIKRNRR